MAARALAENRHRAMIAAVYLPVLVAKVRGTHIPPQLRSCWTLPYHRDSLTPQPPPTMRNFHSGAGGPKAGVNYRKTSSVTPRKSHQERGVVGKAKTARSSSDRSSSGRFTISTPKAHRTRVDNAQGRRTIGGQDWWLLVPQSGSIQPSASKKSSYRPAFVTRCP